jgi:hypothetical protein
MASVLRFGMARLNRSQLFELDSIWLVFRRSKLPLAICVAGKDSAKSRRADKSLRQIDLLPQHTVRRSARTIQKYDGARLTNDSREADGTFDHAGRFPQSLIALLGVLSRRRRAVALCLVWVDSVEKVFFD